MQAVCGFLRAQTLYKHLNLRFYNNFSVTSSPTKRRTPLASDFFRLCSTLDSATFEKTCEETLDSLAEYFEDIVETSELLKHGDVSYSSGVLTVNLGSKYGTYVINKQSPNKQIWLSSPVSGPKRYDFMENKWIYKHDGQSLHQLLQNEISSIVNNVNFANCAYSN